jgi:23S rRNA pseudouridine955/2504/2580 synthase
MKKFILKENEASQRFDKYLKKRLPQAPAAFLYKMLRKKNITLNGRKATGAEKLQVGDEVVLFFSEDTYQKFKGTDTTISSIIGLQGNRLPPLDILYETDDFLLIHKPAGMLSQKAKPTDLSANEYIIHYLHQQGQFDQTDPPTFRPAVCNRLDRNTSGILMAGKTLRGLQELSRQLKERSLEKFYLCLVKGRLKQPQSLSGYLVKDEVHNKVTIIQCPPTNSHFASAQGSYIQTDFYPKEVFASYTLLEVHLLTGKSHQIRAHLAAIGHPIIGDQKYGDSTLNKQFFKQGLKRQFLIAYRVVFENGQTVTTKLDPDLLQVLETIREGKNDGNMELPRS